MTAHRWRNSAGHLIRVDGHHVLCETCPCLPPCECPEWYPASWPANGLLEEYSVSIESSYLITLDRSSTTGPWFTRFKFLYKQSGSATIFTADQNLQCEWTCVAQEYYTNYNLDGTECGSPEYTRDSNLSIYYNGRVWGVNGNSIRNCSGNIVISNDCHSRPPLSIFGQLTVYGSTIYNDYGPGQCGFSSNPCYGKYVLSVSIS